MLSTLALVENKHQRETGARFKAARNKRRLVCGYFLYEGGKSQKPRCLYDAFPLSSEK